MNQEKHIEKIGQGKPEKEKTAQKQTAKFEADSLHIYEKERDRLLDIAATLMRDSPHLSHL